MSDTQLVPQDLAASRRRDLIDELHDPDLLVRRDALGDEAQHLVGSEAMAVLLDHIGLGELVTVGVRDAYDCRVGNARVSEQERLELGWGHLVALVLDEFLRAADDAIEAAFIDGRAVQRQLLLPSWCVLMLRRREEVGVAPTEPVFSTVDGGFRDPRNVSRNLALARERLGFGWVTSHSWRKTMATVLDTSGASARMIAGVLAALEGADPGRFLTKVVTKAMTLEAVMTPGDASSLVREPAKGLEPSTPCLQDRCATDCATPAGPQPSRRVGEMLPAADCHGSIRRRGPTPSGVPGLDAKTADPRLARLSAS